MGPLGGTTDGTAGDFIGGLGGPLGILSTPQDIDGPAAMDLVGNVMGTAGTLANLAGNSPLSSGLGLGSGLFGIAGGVRGMMDEGSPAEDRVASAVNAASGVLGTGAEVASLATTGEGVAMAPLLAADVGSIGAMGATATIASTAAVMAAGAAGYGLGSVVEDAASSDDARDSMWGEDDMTGLSRNPMEAAADFFAGGANRIENLGVHGRDAVRDHASHANSMIDAATGSDALGNAYETVVSGAADLGSDALGTGAHLHAAGLTAAASIPLAFVGFQESMARGAVEAVGGDGDFDLGEMGRSAVSSVASWFD